MRAIKKTGTPSGTPTVRTSDTDTKSVLDSKGKTVSESKGGTVRAVNIVRPATKKEVPAPTPAPPSGEKTKGKKRDPKPPKVKKRKSRAGRVKAQYGKGLGTKGNKTGRGGKTFSGRKTGRTKGKY